MQDSRGDALKSTLPPAILWGSLTPRWNMTKAELLSTPEAADYIGARPHSLEIWRASGRYRIPFVKVGRLVKYRRADLDRWLESRVVNSSEAA